MVHSDISRFIGYILFQMLGFITCRLCSSAHAYSLVVCLKLISLCVTAVVSLRLITVISLMQCSDIS